jgi:hypothetical protein
MEMTQEERDYVRSLNALALTSTEIQYLLDLMQELDPECGPEPITQSGKLVAARTFVRLLQGQSCPPFPSMPSTWRSGHAR